MSLSSQKYSSFKIATSNQKYKSRSYNAKFHIYTNETLNWFQIVFRLQSSVIPAIFPWVLLCGSYGFLISLLKEFNAPIPFIEIDKVIHNVVLTCNIVLSLLLVFRTNTAHERFWEGRKLWGALVNTVRNLARNIWLIIEEREPNDRLEKESSLRLLVAFAVAMKLLLRRSEVNSELEPLMSSIHYFKLQSTNHPPLEIAFWIGDYLQHQYNRKCLDVYQLTTLQNLLNELVDILGGCERILKTPMPLAYAIKLKQLLLIYCILLPFEIVNGLGWWTGLALAFISTLLLGIEEIGSEIEEPFGQDPNDLPLDLICATMLRNVEDLIMTAPTTCSFINDWHLARKE